MPGRAWSVDMSNYDIFAMYYDSLTKNVHYAGRAEYLLKLLERFNHPAGITLDLACGTGSLTLELYSRGVDVYGADASPSMLSVAKDKAYDAGADILFLCQKMQNIDLYGTVDTVICALDSINHLQSAAQIQAAFNRVSLFMNPGGYFVFDFNTVYKHRNILKDNIYVYDTDDVYCVWQNRYRPSNNQVDITLDFFEKNGDTYSRSREHFAEITFEQGVVAGMLEKSGLSVEAVFDDMTFNSPKEDSQRIIFVTKKQE